MRKEFIDKDNIAKEFLLIDRDFLLKVRLILVLILACIVVAPMINFSKFNINFDLFEFIHSDTNIALLWGFFTGMILMSLFIVSLILQSIEK